MSPERRHIRAKIAGTALRRPNADLTELRREYKTATLAQYIEELVNSAPPLNNEQRARLAALLAPGGE